MLSDLQTEQEVIPSVITRRKEPRNQVSIQLRLHRKSQDRQSSELIQTENISRYGACLIMTDPPEVEEMVTLTCVNNECEMRATVKYVRPVGATWRVGVEFVAFPKKWLIMQLAVSAMLEGKFVQPRRRQGRR